MRKAKTPVLSIEERVQSYMESEFGNSNEHEVLGWLPTTEPYHWGTLFEGRQQVCVHLIRKDDWVWGDDPKDTIELAREKPYVLMFLGCDNSSCFQRFATAEEAREEYLTRYSVDWFEPDMIFYNS